MKKVNAEESSQIKRLESLSLIYPAFNEEDNVNEAVNIGYKALSKFADDIEIIIVNDGSSDKTAERLDRLVEEHSYVRAIHHSVNKGYGAALRSGFDAATKQFVFFTDSDLQFDLNEFDRLVKWSNDYDFVVGYREKRADPFIRKLNAFCWNRLIRVVLGVKVRDIDCAFKLFKRDFFQQTALFSSGAMINTEIFAQAKKQKLSIKEVPVSHFERNAGEQTGANIGVIIKAFRELISMQKALSESYIK